MNKRDQVERDAARAAGDRYFGEPMSVGEREHAEYWIQCLHDRGFTICGPDEVPMPKTEPRGQVGWQREWSEMVDAYQRQRNGEGGDATGEVVK